MLHWKWREKWRSGSSLPRRSISSRSLPLCATKKRVCLLPIMRPIYVVSCREQVQVEGAPSRETTAGTMVSIASIYLGMESSLRTQAVRVFTLVWVTVPPLIVK